MFHHDLGNNGQTSWSWAYPCFMYIRNGFLALGRDGNPWHVLPFIKALLVDQLGTMIQKMIVTKAPSCFSTAVII
jgi:hypothetical protein